MARARGTAAPADRPDTKEVVRQAFLTGMALTIPLVLTLVVLQIALNLVGDAVSPIVAGLELLFGGIAAPDVMVEAATVLTLAALVFVVGYTAEYRAPPGRLSEGFDAMMARIPGLGSVYTGIRRMSEVLLEQDTQSFQEVVLVEFPNEDTYMLAFVTAEPPASVHDAASAGEMQTLFVPLAPNPVMGGFLINRPVDRVHEIDMTVEEGVQAIVTSGTALDPRIEETDAPEMPSLKDAEAFVGDVISGEVLDDAVLSDEGDRGRRRR